VTTQAASTYVQVAETPGQIARCKELIALVYSSYGVSFSDEAYDIERKVERWPHRFLMAERHGQVVAVVGLYIKDTYVERFGRVSKAQLARVLVGNDVQHRYSVDHTREITKISVHPHHRDRGLGRLITRCAFAEAFLQRDAARRHLVLACAKHSVWHRVFGGAGIRNRFIGEFPNYKIHELYRSEQDPMDSRMIIPDIDIPDHVYRLSLPVELPDYEHLWAPRRAGRLEAMPS
jgi:ribosomal protein S18 acetylase RimI-like enzyme